MITLGELKRMTGFKSFGEFQKNIMHSAADKNRPSHTNYFYKQPESQLNDNQFQTSLSMTWKELEKAVRKEKEMLNVAMEN